MCAIYVNLLNTCIFFKNPSFVQNLLDICAYFLFFFFHHIFICFPTFFLHTSRGQVKNKTYREVV